MPVTPRDAGKDQAAIEAHIEEVNAELLKIGAIWDTNTSKVVVVDVTQGCDVFSMTVDSIPTRREDW